MLWDVDLYWVLTGLILLVTGVIVAAITWVIIRRIKQGRYYRYLDLQRDRFRPLINSIVEGNFSGDLAEIRWSPQTTEWQAIEDLLLKQIDQPAEEKQRRATEAFEILNYVDFYLKELRVKVPWRRSRAVHRLGMMRSTKAIPDLLQALEDQDYDVRQNVIQALGQIQNDQTLGALVSKINQAAEQTRGISKRVLMAALIPYGVAAIPLLIDKLADRTDSVRALVAEVLGEIPHLKALDALTRVLEDVNPQVRARAAYALGRIGHPLAVQPLIAALLDGFWYVRLQAARSLGQLGSPQSIYSLSLLLTDSNAQVRLAAAESLVHIGPLAFPALTTQLLYTADSYAREQIAEILQKSGFIERWIEDLDSANETTQKHAQGLLVAATKGKSISSMLHLLQNHPRPQIRLRLIEILGQAGEPDTVKSIHHVALHDPDPVVRERAHNVVVRVMAKNKGKMNNGMGNSHQRNQLV